MHRPKHGARKLIGYGRLALKVHMTRIPKCICEADPECGVTEEPPAETPGRAKSVQHVRGCRGHHGKYGHHLPIAAPGLFASSRWTPARSTLLDILAACSAHIRLFIHNLRVAVLAGGVLGTARATFVLPPEIPCSRASTPTTILSCEARYVRAKNKKPGAIRKACRCGIGCPSCLIARWPRGSCRS